MSKVIVIGAGAAGMMAAYAAANIGHHVTLIEKNEKFGKKIYITGKGRCNLTNDCDMDTFLQNVITNKKFLYSAYYSFSTEMCIDLFESLGLKTKVERGNRVFPVSDHASDVTSVLENELKRQKVKILLKTKVDSLIIENDEVKGVITNKKERFEANSVIVTTGGLSYQTTGSTGDGLKFAKQAGHNIVECRPALVPFLVEEQWIKNLQGLALKNIEIKILNKKGVLYKDFGELMFTHFGVSGPVILSASSHVTRILTEEQLKLSIDLKPALDEETLDKRILREWKDCQNKQFKNVLNGMFPNKIIPMIIEKSEINPDKKINEVTKEERKNLIKVTKNFECTISKTADFNEAIITQGGVNIKEINPSTMESKNVSGLYFAGEVLDVDALTGGFNLQIAWSTGYLAGISIE